MIHEANQLGNQIRIDIKQIERSNQTTSADYQLRTSQKQNLVKKFMQSLTEYQSIQQSYQRQQQERARRQYLIVNPSATQAELTAVMDGAHSGPVFAQQLMASQQYGSAKRMMDDVQARHEEIVRLAQSIEQLQQLFLDMQTMVEMQDAHIMQVASHLNETAASTRNAAEEMQVAVKHKKTSIKRRRVMICCLIILLITVACVIMLMPGWPTNIIDAINRSKQPSSATK
jgi:syntaxin 1B/2/3